MLEPVERNCICRTAGLDAYTGDHSLECDEAYRQHFFSTVAAVKKVLNDTHSHTPMRQV